MVMKWNTCSFSKGQLNFWCAASDITKLNTQGRISVPFKVSSDDAAISLRWVCLLTHLFTRLSLCTSFNTASNNILIIIAKKWFVDAYSQPYCVRIHDLDSYTYQCAYCSVVGPHPLRSCVFMRVCTLVLRLPACQALLTHSRISFHQ